MHVANPLSLSFNRWATALTMDNGLAISPPLGEENWVEWAQDLRDTVSFGAELPAPSYYDSWQPWALDAMTALERH